MGLNRPFDRAFFTINGNVKTTGSSKTLAKGQLAFADTFKTTPDGVPLISNFAGYPKDQKRFTIRCGITEKEPNRTYSNKDESSMPFSLKDIIDLRVSVPEITEQKVDEVVIGYDGITPNSSFRFQTGDAYFQLAVELTGDAISYLGGGIEKEIVVVKVDIPNCDPFNTCVDCDTCESVDCKAITLEVIEQLRRRQISGGKTLEQLVEITPVFECDNDVTATLLPHTFYTLEVCDTGTDNALALVQAQYDYPVIRIDRRGATSVYQVLTNDAGPGAPADYDQTLASVIKGCDTCPAGYTEVPGGLLYAFTIEDGGTNLSAVFTALPNYVANTVVRSANNDGVGFYTAIYSAELSESTINTLVTTNGATRTVTVDFLGELAAICEDDTISSTGWVAGKSCNAVAEEYTIILPDNECGEDRLAELQGAYPDLTIAIDTNDALASIDLTLSGTSGTANVNIDGTNYLATFATSLTVTANNFVTAHAATILATHDITVTSPSAGVLRFVGPVALIEALEGESAVNATGDLTGTFDATADTVEFRQNCSTQYTTTVISNLVCEECSPIFEDFYKTSAPEEYDLAKWTRAENTTTSPSGNCKCGIRFKGKPFTIAGDEALRDITGFVETSTQIRVSAGFPEEIREGIGSIPEGAFEGKYLSRYVQRTHLGGNLRDIENESRAYFRGLHYRKDYLGRLLRGETSNIEDQFTQYIHYTLVVKHPSHQQGWGQMHTEYINYNIYVEVGRHNAIENILNNLASSAGVATVQAFP